MIEFSSNWQPSCWRSCFWRARRWRRCRIGSSPAGRPSAAAADGRRFHRELAQDNPCAREAGLRRGDVIRAIDGERVSTVRQVTAAVSASGGQALTIRYERGGKAAETAVQPQRTADGWRLGVFVRDSITGIGTVTYYDPENGTFGALGHGVCDSSACSRCAAALPCPPPSHRSRAARSERPARWHGL